MEQPLTINSLQESFREGKIKGYVCAQCGNKTIDIAVFCSRCLSPNLRPVEFGITGKIVTYTIQHIATESFIKEVPYAWVIVELDEGVWVTGWIPSIGSPDELEIGQKVRAVRSDKPGPVFEKI